MGRTATVVAVASQSTPGKSYQVWVGADGPIFCDCPAHKYARHGVRKPCKHMVELGSSTDVLTVARGLADEAITRSFSVPPAVVGGARRPAANKTRTERQSSDDRFRFLEVQEETDEGTWVQVTDLRSFSNLEVD